MYMFDTRDFQFPLLGSRMKKLRLGALLRISFNSLYWVPINWINPCHYCNCASFNSLYWVLIDRAIRMGRYDLILSIPSIGFLLVSLHVCFGLECSFNSLYWVQIFYNLPPRFTYIMTFNSLYWVLVDFAVCMVINTDTFQFPLLGSKRMAT